MGDFLLRRSAPNALSESIDDLKLQLNAVLSSQQSIIKRELTFTNAAISVVDGKVASQGTVDLTPVNTAIAQVDAKVTALPAVDLTATNTAIAAIPTIDHASAIAQVDAKVTALPAVDLTATNTAIAAIPTVDHSSAIAAIPTIDHTSTIAAVKTVVDSLDTKIDSNTASIGSIPTTDQTSSIATLNTLITAVQSLVSSINGTVNTIHSNNPGGGGAGGAHKFVDVGQASGTPGTGKTWVCFGHGYSNGGAFIGHGQISYKRQNTSNWITHTGGVKTSYLATGPHWDITFEYDNA
jgi:hypothetical protein